MRQYYLLPLDKNISMHLHEKEVKKGLDSPCYPPHKSLFRSPSILVSVRTPATTTTCIPLVYLNITYRFGEEFLYTLVVPTPSTYTSLSKSFLWWVHPSGQDSEIDQI